MKKRLYAFIILIFAISLFAGTAFAKPESVVDNAGILSAEEKATLTKQLDDIKTKYNFDAAIVTEQQMSGEDAEQTADDIFDYESYGVGEGYDGILFYVSVEPRLYHISTHGTGIEYFNPRGLAYLEEQFLPSLENDDYNGAFLAYADTADELLAMAESGSPYNKASSGEIVLVWGAALLFSLILALIMTAIKLAAMKTARKENLANNYMKPGSMQLAYSKDIFLFSRVTRVAKPKNTSSTHTSSSGQTHGGTGGSY